MSHHGTGRGIAGREWATGRERGHHHDRHGHGKRAHGGHAAGHEHRAHAGHHDERGEHGPRREGEGDGERRRRKRRRREHARDEDGRFETTVDLEDVLGVFDAVAGPVVTTTDVADVLGVSTEAAREKLNRLVDRGDLRRRKTGRTVVYWRTDGDGDD